MSMSESEEHLRRWRNHLLHRIHKRFRTTVRRHIFDSLSLDFTRIDNPDVVLDQVAEEETRRWQQGDKDREALRLPYWAQLWDSAPGIGQFLTSGRLRDSANNRIDLRDRDVLDLGCGMGLSGTVAAALGARVLFADLETPALLFARLNSLPWHQRVRTRRMNWQTDRLDERFDLILGADILYEKSQWEFLEPFWRAHLKKDGVVLLGEPGRQTGGMFLEWIADKHWRVERYEEKVPDFDTPIRLIVLRLA